MKIDKMLKIASVALGVVVGLGSVNAMDPEFADLNAAQAKLKGSHYKARLAVPQQLVVAEPAFAHTNTLELLKSFQTHNLDPLITAERTTVKAAVGAYIDTLMVGNTPFLNKNVARQDNAGGPNTPATVARNDFKAALDAHFDTLDFALLNGVNPLIVHPADLNFRTLENTVSLIHIQMAAQTDAYIDTLLVGNTSFGKKTIARQDNAGGPNTPATRARNDFKDALSAVISNY